MFSKDPLVITDDKVINILKDTSVADDEVLEKDNCKLLNRF
jgi:hypothetical protein